MRGDRSTWITVTGQTYFIEKPSTKCREGVVLGESHESGSERKRAKRKVTSRSPRANLQRPHYISRYLRAREPLCGSHFRPGPYSTEMPYPRLRRNYLVPVPPKTDLTLAITSHHSKQTAPGCPVPCRTSTSCQSCPRRPSQRLPRQRWRGQPAPLPESRWRTHGDASP